MKNKFSLYRSIYWGKIIRKNGFTPFFFLVDRELGKSTHSETVEDGSDCTFPIDDKWPN